MRALVAVLALSLLTMAALASTPQVEAVAKAFQSLASDANRLKTFCELIEIEQEDEEKAGPLLATKMGKMLDELGIATMVAPSRAEKYKAACDELSS
jgi:hypothetical protein